MTARVPDDRPMPDHDERIPDPSFAGLVLMLATGAIQYLGLAPDPILRKTEPNLDLARHAIDTLEILERKTAGNLTDDERELLGGLLHDLRLKYVAAVERKPAPAEKPAPASDQGKKGEA